MFMKPLSPDTLWLRIPDFDDRRAKPLKDILDANAAALASTANLVIDLRNNGGGADFVYGPLTPLLYSRPVYSVMVEMRASEDNIALLKVAADGIRTQAPGVARQMDSFIERMAVALGTFVPAGDQILFVKRLDTVMPFPKRVAVLVDNAASTGEQFLLEARQSRKVTLFGKENSAGVLDFSNTVDMPTPSGRYRVFWATSRSLRLPGDPVDPDGIAPDIRIPADERDPVAFAQRWLERQVD
jgi:C-terminal processing protease CtpA/Prc